MAYLIEEHRVLRRQLEVGGCLRLTDEDRRQLAARAYFANGIIKGWTTN